MRNWCNMGLSMWLEGEVGSGVQGWCDSREGFLLINESPIGYGPSTEMRVDGKGHAGCWRRVCCGMKGVKEALLVSFVGRLSDKLGGEM
jgi:hypothetical protein